MAQRDQRADEARAAVGAALQALAAAARCWPRPGRARSRFAVGEAAGERREVRRGHARRAAERVDAQARVVGDRRAVRRPGRMARLGERVLDEAWRAAPRPRRCRARPAPPARCRQAGEQALQLGQLLGVVRRQDEPHRRTRVRPRRCRGPGAAPRPARAMPLVGQRQQRVHLAPREGRALGRALHLDEAARRRSSRRSCRCRRRSPRRTRGRAAACPATMPTDTAATASRIGERCDLALGQQPGHRVVRGDVGAGDRRGARAAVGLQHVAVERDRALAERDRSNTQRSERPIRRWISCVRPLCLPRAASRSLRVWVARGSMPYSAVTQPSPLPRLCGGTLSSTEAVHSTWVSPKATSTEPSAWRV